MRNTFSVLGFIRFCESSKHSRGIRKYRKNNLHTTPVQYIIDDVHQIVPSNYLLHAPKVVFPFCFQMWAREEVAPHQNLTQYNVNNRPSKQWNKELNRLLLILLKTLVCWWGEGNTPPAEFERGRVWNTLKKNRFLSTLTKTDRVLCVVAGSLTIARYLPAAFRVALRSKNTNSK